MPWYICPSASSLGKLMAMGKSLGLGVRKRGGLVLVDVDVEGCSLSEQSLDPATLGDKSDAPAVDVKPIFRSRNDP